MGEGPIAGGQAPAGRSFSWGCWGSAALCLSMHRHLSMHRLVPTVLLVLVAVAAPAPSAAQTKSNDLRRSTITIHVGKTGLFSAAGHDHWVSAPIASGEITDTSSRSVNFTVDA